MVSGSKGPPFDPVFENPTSQSATDQSIVKGEQAEKARSESILRSV